MQRARQFEHTGAVDEDGVVYAEGAAPLELPAAWTPEHLLLAAVARCTLKSLRFYARGARVEGSASMRSIITRRETDGLFALVEADIDLEVRIEPEPAPEKLRELLERAELGCFVGNSLAVEPRYRWRVNGRPAREGG
jgi:organic hydroperoxide reductase OsmC/OhrA